MRPTELGVKAPFNKTPAAAYPVVCHTGQPAVLTRSASGYSFSSQQRFSHYHVDAKKLSFRVGPGAYNLSQTSIGVKRVPKVHAYKANTYPKHFDPAGFYYSGNLLVFEDKFVTKWNKRKAQTVKVAAEQLSPKKSNTLPKRKTADIRKLPANSFDTLEATQTLEHEKSPA